MSRSSTRLAQSVDRPAMSTTTPDLSDAPSRRSSKRRTSSVASSSGVDRGDHAGRHSTASVSSSTPRKRARPAIDSPARESSSGKDDLWDEDLDEVLFRGMEILPKMGRRAIYLEDDDESFGRNGLLGEYLRRQTGKIRNRTQIASHLAVLRKNRPNDQRLAQLSVGHEISPAAFSATRWSALLGPDLHPSTQAAAKAENDKVKRHREDVVLAFKARRGSSSVAGGSSPAPAGRRPVQRRDVRKPPRGGQEEDDDEEDQDEEQEDSQEKRVKKGDDSDLTDPESDALIDSAVEKSGTADRTAPPSASAVASTRRARAAAAAPTPSSAFHFPGGGRRTKTTKTPTTATMTRQGRTAAVGARGEQVSARRGAKAAVVELERSTAGKKNAGRRRRHLQQQQQQEEEAEEEEAEQDQGPEQPPPSRLAARGASESEVGVLDSDSAEEMADVDGGEEDDEVEDEAPHQSARSHSAAMDVEPFEVAAPEEVAQVAASARTTPGTHLGQGQEQGIEAETAAEQEVDEDVRVGAGFLSGVKKGLWKLVGF